METPPPEPEEEDGDRDSDTDYIPLSELGRKRRHVLSAKHGQQAARRAARRPESAQTPTMEVRVGSRASQASVEVAQQGLSRVSATTSTMSSAPTMVNAVPVAEVESVAPGAACARCSLVLQKAKTSADQVAIRTGAELRAMGSGRHSVYNYRRLREIVKQNCFTSLGGWAVHAACAARLFSVNGECLSPHSPFPAVALPASSSECRRSLII